MKSLKRIICILLTLPALFTVAGLQSSTELSWKKIDDGLYLSEFLASKKSILGDSKITILKIDPSKYNFNLLSAKRKGERTRTADEWAKEKNQIAVINAGMYQADYATNVGYMKDYDFVNNSRLNSDNTILAFNSVDKSVSEVQIIDLKCQNWEEMKTKYNSFTQSIRMVDCNQKNRWSKQAKKWSMVVIGIDKDGNVLFIFSRSPYSVYDFINILLAPSIKLYNAMYLEGGPEASFYLNHNAHKVAKMGSYETDFNENDDNHRFWQIPNVIGISKK